MTVYIFGDSFADLNIKKFESDTWYTKLTSIYDVKNFAKAGTGPIYSFNIFYDVMQNIMQNDVIIFILSSPIRIPFSFLDDENIQMFSSVVFGDNRDKEEFKQIFFKDDIRYKKNKFYIDLFLKNKDKIIEYFNARGKEIIFENIKNILFLKYYSKINNIKTFCFLSFDISSIWNFTDLGCDELAKHLMYDINFSEKLYEMTLELTDDLFYFHHEPLSKVSFCQHENDSFSQDNLLNNHLTENNHNIMYDFLDKKIKGSKNQLKFSVFESASGKNFIYV